jgi:hypothetical protein
MFLGERAIILFLEYITLSSDIESNGYINLVDVKLFIYKKTLGPIQLKNKKLSLLHISKIYHYAIIMKNILLKVFQLTIEKDFLGKSTDSNSINSNSIKNIVKQKELIEDNLDYVSGLLTDTLFQIINLNSTTVKSDILDDILNLEHVNNENILMESIITVQLKLEIYHYIFSVYPNNFRKNCQIFNSLEFECPVECYKHDVDILETDYYKNMIQDIDLHIFENK